MTKQEFTKLSNDFFKKKGFLKKGKNYYNDFQNGIVGIFGFQKSNYGEYYYIEYGYAFSSVNPKMPYPNFSELNLNCGRLKFQFETITQEVYYENLDVNVFLNTLNNYVEPFLIAGTKGKNAIIDMYIPNCEYIIGNCTLRYLGIENNDLTVYPESLWD